MKPSIISIFRPQFLITRNSFRPNTFLVLFLISDSCFPTFLVFESVHTHITLSCIPFRRSHNQRQNVSCRVVSCLVVSCHVMLCYS